VPLATEKLELDSDIKADELLLLNCLSEYIDPKGTAIEPYTLYI